MSDEETPHEVAVHPDVIAAAQAVITALQGAEAEIGRKGYHLGGSVLNICIDEQEIVTVKWVENHDAWCLIATEVQP